jgi:hypothetical protein
MVSKNLLKTLKINKLMVSCVNHKSRFFGNGSYTGIGLHFWNNRIPNERKNAGTVYVPGRV